jgi:hypothetical protein
MWYAAEAMRDFVHNEIDYDMGKEIDRGEWEALDPDDPWTDLANKFFSYLTARYGD